MEPKVKVAVARLLCQLALQPKTLFGRIPGGDYLAGFSHG